MVRAVAESDVLPNGALSLLCGAPDGLLEALQPGDVFAFTGSAETAARIARALAGRGVKLNVEADGLNSSLLGPDGAPGSASFNLLTAEVVKEMTAKAGQKCTAIRRVFAPADRCDALAEAIAARLAEIRVGDPADPAVGMGPVVSQGQRRSVDEDVAALVSAGCRQVTDSRPPLQGANWETGAFVAPTLLRAEGDIPVGDELEVIGPVAAIVRCSDASSAFPLEMSGRRRARTKGAR